MTRKRIGIVLFQLGGPDSAEAVEPFLYNLFSDPDIINFPLAWMARRPLARFIARRRAKVVWEHYHAIGGHSPIRQLTERQARKLEQALAPEFDARCWVAMRYWHPLTAEAAESVRGVALDALVLLPLYPQYSFATTLSSLKEWKRVYRPLAGAPGALVIEEFHQHPQYIEAVAEKVRISLTHFDEPCKVHLVFSAHGLPLSLIERGDPYQRQVEETVGAVLARGGWPNPRTLCYQSRVGRQKWLEPSLRQTIERLAHSGEKQLLVIPIAFVTEHIETLHEINMEARAEALSAGIEQFEMMPALGDSATFVDALASLVRSALAGQPRTAPALATAAVAENFKPPRGGDRTSRD
jgi:protoporphyrin/coproporphyrin ferrochelatase